VRKVLEGGKRVAWGAKAIPEGGYWAIPKLHAPGMVIAGDAAGMVNVPKLKGVHYAILAGKLAGGDDLPPAQGGVERLLRVRDAGVRLVHRRDLYESRNMKQPFERGLVVGGAVTNMMVATKGRFPPASGTTTATPTSRCCRRTGTSGTPSPDGKYIFDKLSSVFITGNETRDDAPSHIRIQKRVDRDVAEMWSWMCPAGVYEIPEDAPGHRSGRPPGELHELRAVRGDHRQGRPPRAARGRRRARLPDRLTRSQLRGCGAVLRGDMRRTLALLLLVAGLLAGGGVAVAAAGIPSSPARSRPS
jgi:hypothetical protein